DSERAAESLRQLYAPLTSGNYYRRSDAVPAAAHGAALPPPPLLVTNSKSAELIKHASNAFLAMKISFINAVANLCEAVGADVSEVKQGMGLDSRIGTRFLEPGLGYGGSCFPKDLMAFRAVAQERGYDFSLLTEVMKINEEQRRLFVKKVRTALWNLRGKALGVLGLAFKGGTDDVRESPAIEIVRALVKEGCVISVYDPAAMERGREVLGDAVRYAATPAEAAAGADALLILTDWPEFAHLKLASLAEVMKHPLLIDGRNLYRPAEAAAAGFTYMSMGRPLAEPQPNFASAAAGAASGPPSLGTASLQPTGTGE
ncbi:MAG TPA: nucleotide sugar dehydrogenase, partial [Terriglobales bacterium]|nr:nucleotide sugar dehydrogenase [Terriglobales bacterium]